MMTIDIIRAENLAPLPHGFFTRNDGVSKDIFAELNCGLQNGDEVENVLKNREIAVQSLGRPSSSLVTATQTHSSNAVIVNELPDEPISCDGMVTSSPRISLGVLTADCQPILLADKQAGVVGAAHAGWRGALSGIIENTITEMIYLGARRNRICAAIGPSICRESYEVGPEFHEEFLGRDLEFDRYFCEGVGDRVHLDLQAFSLEMLRREDVGSAEWTGQCTYKDPSRFFSYRRSTHMHESEFGVMISIIGI